SEVYVAIYDELCTIADEHDLISMHFEAARKSVLITPRSIRRRRQPQAVGNRHVVSHPLGGLPVPLTHAEVEPLQRRFARQVAGRMSLLVGGAEGERHARLTRDTANRELADRFISARGFVDASGAEARLGEFREVEQIRPAQRVVTLL